MITTIDQNGLMTIKPENELEAYALKCWADSHADNGFIETSRLIIRTRLDTQP